MSETVHTSIQPDAYTLPFLPFSPLDPCPTYLWLLPISLSPSFPFQPSTVSRFHSAPIILGLVTSPPGHPNNPNNPSPRPPATCPAKPGTTQTQQQGLDNHFHSQVGPWKPLTHPFPPLEQPSHCFPSTILHICITLFQTPSDLCPFLSQPTSSPHSQRNWRL